MSGPPGIEVGGTSTAFRQTAYMKSRLRPPCVVANPRHSYGYGCGLRLARLSQFSPDSPDKLLISLARGP